MTFQLKNLAVILLIGLAFQTVSCLFAADVTPYLVTEKMVHGSLTPAFSRIRTAMSPRRRRLLS